MARGFDEETAMDARPMKAGMPEFAQQASAVRETMVEWMDAYERMQNARDILMTAHTNYMEAKERFSALGTVFEDTVTANIVPQDPGFLQVSG